MDAVTDLVKALEPHFHSWLAVALLAVAVISLLVLYQQAMANATRD